MSNKVFMMILVVVGLLLAAAVVMHTPAGMSMLRSMHGGN